MQSRLNLATKPYFRRQAVCFWLSAAAVVLSLVMALNMVFGYQNYRQYKRVGVHLEELDQRISEVKGVVPAEYNPQAFEKALEQVAGLNRILVIDQFRWTSLLTRLEELLPDEVSIHNVQPDFSHRSLKISAVSRDVQGMKDFLDALLLSADMNQVYLQQHREEELERSTARGSRLVSFSLEVRDAF